MKKRKIIIWIFIAVVIIILLVPFKLQVKDGSVIYKALTYKVYKYHHWHMALEQGDVEIWEGTRVEILGIGVYDDYNDVYSEDGEVYLEENGNYIPYFKFLFRIIKERLTKDTAAEAVTVFAA